MNTPQSNPQSELKRLQSENANLLWLIEQSNTALAKLRAQLAATEEALAQVQRESAELRRKAEAARKVADAAVALSQTDTTGGIRGLQEANWRLADAVREYRTLTEPPAKQSAVDAVPERLGDEKAVEDTLWCKCGHSSNFHGLPKGCRVVDCSCWSFRPKSQSMQRSK
jgi:hypothetical protein